MLHLLLLVNRGLLLIGKNLRLASKTLYFSEETAVLEGPDVKENKSEATNVDCRCNNGEKSAKISILLK